MSKAEIPKELAHLRVDERGYAIPYFVPIHNGKPEFKYTDQPKVIDCIERNRCGICGKKLYSDYCYVIIGPLGLGNKVSSEPAMHRVCAEYSLRACPHMYNEKAKRVDTDNSNQPFLLNYKPTTIFLVKCRTKKVKWKLKQQNIWVFYPVSHEIYHYVNGFLEKQNEIKT